MSLADRLKGVVPTPPKKRREPLWQGPEVDGITFSMLSRFLTCRERFRVRVVEGLRPADAFNHRIEYGQMWHVCEEALAKLCRPEELRAVRLHPDFFNPLKEYVQGLCRRYPLSQEQIDHWYNVCLVQFPLYVEYWAKHPDVTSRTPLLQEKVFDVPYQLPSGRVVRLRGKWDSVDLVGNGKDGQSGTWLQENKTKGDIDEAQMQRQLTFDLQTMIYLVALDLDRTLTVKVPWTDTIVERYPIRGVHYNVVRRPLSGGKGTIIRHKPSKSNPAGESKADYYQRVARYVRDEPEHYFMRWRVTVTPSDVARFRRECLDPILEQLCDWWEWIASCDGQPFLFGQRLKPGKASHPAIHWRHPFGCANTIDEYGSSDMDAYLESGSEAGLQRIEDLFPELK